MDKLGFFAFMLGAAGMDSPNQFIPALLCAAGMILIGLTILKEKGLTPYLPKHWKRPLKKYHIIIITREVGKIKK